jgi:hypothetical protein
MDIKILFKNYGKPWLPEDEILINKLYNEDKLDILEISTILGRTPCGIIRKLIKNNYIGNRIIARGYKEYLNSDLYKELLLYNNNNLVKKNKKEKQNKEQNSNIELNKEQNIYNKYILDQIQNHIKEIKNELKELVKILKNG